MSPESLQTATQLVFAVWIVLILCSMAQIWKRRAILLRPVSNIPEYARASSPEGRVNRFTGMVLIQLFFFVTAATVCFYRKSEFGDETQRVISEAAP